MPLNVFGDTVEQEVNAFGDPVEAHSGEIQKLNHTELGKLPQFQPEKISMLDKMAGPLADYVVGPIANIPNAIRGVAAEGMNLPFRAARAMGLYPESQQRMRISPDQFDANGNVVPGSISQSNVPIPIPYNANYVPQVSFNPTPMRPTQPEGITTLNKILGMATPDVALGAPLVGPRATAAFFAPQMVAQVPQMVQHGAEQVMNPTLSGREKVIAGGNTLADLLMTLAVTHGALPEAQHPSGIGPGDITDLGYSRIPEERQLNAPPSGQPKALLPRFAQSEITGMTQPSSGEPIQLPQLTGEPRFAASPAGQMADLGQLTELEKLALLRRTMQPPEVKGQYQPIADLRQPNVEQPIITPPQNAPGGPILPPPAVKPEPLGGQISFNSPANANAIPNALQQAQPSLAQMLEDAIKRNQIEKEQNASSIRSNEESLPGITGQTGQEKIQQAASGALRSGDLQQESQAGIGANGTELRTASQGAVNDLTRSEEGGLSEPVITSKETSPPTTSDFEKYSELRQQAKEFNAKGEFPPSELLRQMEEIKNRNKGMPPKEETTVPLNERLQARLKAFNDAQAKRIQSGDSMGRIDAGLLEDVVNIGRLAYGSAKDFASWSGEMVKKLGEYVKPHLQEVWDNVKRAYDTRPTNTAMVMQAGELVSQPAKLRLGLDKDGKYDAGQAVARLRNTLGESSAEWQVLKETGIQERFKPGQKVTPEELREWVDENGPKVEVRKFANSKGGGYNSVRVAEISHELDTILGNSAAQELRQYGDIEDLINRDQIPEGKEDHVRKLFQEYDELKPTFSDSPTANWSSIAPKAEKDMPGYVELAVVKPQKMNESFGQYLDRMELKDTPETRAWYQDYKQNKASTQPQFPSSHFFPPNTLAFARGYMETTKDGKKVFHVIEVQSDWAQDVRNMLEGNDHLVNAEDPPEPLLAHYERLALKAAIEHAKKEGASAIAVSDYPTVALTELHDRDAASRGIFNTEKEAERKAALENLARNTDKYYAHKVGDKWVTTSMLAGDELHYDRTLPKIVEELTGQKGERVEFGEHRMALEKGDDVTGNEGQMIPRSDLIFRNPDNTPKTSISAKMFDLSKVTDEPKTLFGKDRPSEVNVKKTKEALAPKTGGIGTGMKKAIEGNQEAGSVSLQGFKDLGDATKKAIKGLSVDFQVLKDSFNRASEFRDVVMKNQAIEGGALTTATRAENHVNLEATRIFGKDSEIARNAAIAVLESKRDKAMLPTFLKQAAKNKEAIEGIKFAQANWNKLQPLANAIEAVDTFNRSTAKAAGVEIPYLSDYLKRAYERDTGWLTRPKVQPGTGMSSRLKRQYDSIYEAIEDGHSPVSFDSAALVGKRTREIFNEVNQHLWVEHLKNTKDSVTGEPILTDITGKGKVRLPPEGYVKVELPSGKSLGVLEGYDRLVKALTGESDIANSLAGRVLLETQQGIKHSTLAFDFFHLSRVAMFRKSFGLKNMYKKGLSILEFSDADLNEAKNQGLIDRATVDYSRGKVDTSFGPISRREVVSLGIKNGLGVGRHSEALYTSFIRSIPLVGDLNRFIFDKFTRGAIAESFVNKFAEQSKYHPTMSKAAVAQMVARDINFRMGNIQKQGIFKSATMQDLLRIPLLAPSWVESMAQSEARSVGQVGKALLPGKNFMKPGVLGKSTAALVASFVVGTQVINMLSKGQPTWKNGDGHQLDAWVPPVTKNGKGFWISPLSVAAEITHDLLRFSKKGSAVDASARIAENKLSPLGQGVKLFITGQDWKGEEHHGGDRLWSAIAAAFNPTPLIGKQAIASIQSKDVAPLERQAFALGGVKAEPESYNEQKQRIIDNMKSGKSMTLFERKQLEEQLKSLRQTPSDAAKVAITTRATEQMLERKNGLRDELPDDIKSWLKHENLDITGFDNAFSYRKTRIGLTQDEADRYKEIVKDAYVQFLSAHVGQQMTQEKLDRVLIKARNYARKQMKGEMLQ